MADNILTARTIHMHDIEANWKKASSFIPKQGEVVVYDKDEVYTYQRIKVGDGVTKINDLPFTVEVALEGYLSFSDDVGYIDAGKISEY